MASASDTGLSTSVLAELRRYMALYGVRRDRSGGASVVERAVVPESMRHLLEVPLPRKPLAVAVDVYGTILASASGECTADAPEGLAPSEGFPADMAQRLRSIVEHDHAEERSRGIPWPEVDAPMVFARALSMPLDALAYVQGARACVAWECAMNPCVAMPGAADALRALAACGLPLAVVSNAQFYSPLFVEAAFGVPLYGSGGLGFDPELMLWSYVERRAKPDRWMFDELSRRLGRRGVPVDRVLYVGNDALNDCAAAGEAGLMTALFAGDARSFKPRVGEPRVLATPPSTMVGSWDALRRITCT
jgi:putative hydrolase of the HAD superfamily